MSQERHMAALREGDLLTVAQARRLFPVSRTRIYELVADGSIPTIRVPSARPRGRGTLLICRRGLESYVAGLAAPAVPPPAESPDDILARVEAEQDGDVGFRA